MKSMLFLFVGAWLSLGFLGIKGAEGQTGSSEVMKELEDFQKSLSGWMQNLDAMGAQFSALQKNMNETLAPLKELDKGVEKKLDVIAARVKAVEESTSVAEVKGVIDSFGKTFDTFKELFAKLSKRVEDQEIKTSVLEKRYQEAERPLEPFKKEVENLKSSVGESLAEQEKTITTRLASLDTQAKVIAELEMRLDQLEAMRKDTDVGTISATAQAPPPGEKEVEEEVVEAEKPVEEKEVVKEEEERISTPEEEGFKEIGEGFYIRNISLTQFGSSSQMQGEIKNLSGNAHSLATFQIKVFDKVGMLLFKQDFSIRSFTQDEVRTFTEIITGYTPADIAILKVQTRKGY
ncbi:MAG: hypothetical protein MRJ65_00950 [Candidatus Brocadiaceae bacterium]|nr:hypothetical protein [Candidatus Brocadiaceae bacterium]